MALYIGGVHPTLAGVAIALLIPVFTPERRQVEEAVELIRAFRQSPNSEYARAATRGLRESISINERLQTQFGPYVSFLVLPLFALVNAGVRLTAETMSAAMRSPLTWGIVAGLVLGKFIGITGATWLVQRFGWGQLAPGPDIAPGRGRRGAVRNRFHHLAFHHRHRDRTIRCARTRPASACCSRRCLAFLLGWAIFRVTDWVSPPEPIGLKLVRPVDPDRDHVRGKPAAPLTLVEYGDFECPFCSRATGSIDQVRAHFGDQLRYVWRHLPLERVHPRAFDAARASEAAALQGRFWEMAREMFDHPG